MAASSMRFIFIILTFVTVGMIFGALLQLAFIRIEGWRSHGAKSSLARIQHLNGASVSYWGDKEASVLCLGYAGTGECSCGGKMVKRLSVKPIKGDVVLFWIMGLDGQSDPTVYTVDVKYYRGRNGRRQNG